MSTQIKNTLFRFATMRTPELLEEEKINALFVQHPEKDKSADSTYESVFLQAANHISLNTTKKNSLNSAALTFTTNALKNDKALYESNLISKELYDFAIWLTKNRTKITIASVNEKIALFDQTFLSQLSQVTESMGSDYLIELWDNLFYQIITSKSNYVRETILSVLVADFFLKNYNQATQTDKEFQKLAQARVVIPHVLFEKEDTTTIKAQLQQQIEALPVVTKELDQDLKLLMVQKQIESRKQHIRELKKAQTIYNKTNQKAYQLALKNHEEAVAQAYANAETVQNTITDPVTGQQTTVTEYVNLVLPVFEFAKAPELQPSLLTSKTSQKTASVVDGLIDSNEFETFDEVIEFLESEIENATQYLFENSNLNETFINANGIVLPITSAISSPVFSISASSSNAISDLLIVFSDNIIHSDIVAATYTITFDDNTTISETSFTDSISNNRLYINAFRNNLNYYGKSSFSITGILTRSDGSKIEFNGLGDIQENSLGLQKILANDGDGNFITYDLVGNGSYTLEPVIISGETGVGTSSSTGSTSGNIIDYIPSGFGVKRMGILDYRKVEQEVCCYVPGEVSHIENIMAREYKEKSTRRLRHSENTVTKSNESEVEKLTDTTSTDRFEMNQEIASLLAKDTHFGANASGGYSQGSQEGSGVVTVNAGADFATNTTSEESNSQAVTHAKEVTQRALDRVVQKTKEERISKIVEEFEETNKHGFDNTKSENHVSGTYRWIDKIYRNQVINYGKRLMYEFMIPEPAAFQKIASTIKKEIGVETIEKPIDPRLAKTENVLKLDETFDAKYKFWARLYNVELSACPEKTIYVGKSLDINCVKNGGASKSDTLQIPDGYATKSAKVKASGLMSTLGGPLVTVSIGEHSKALIPSGWNSFTDSVDFVTTNKHQKQLSISASASYYETATVTISVECELTNEAYINWQQKTFNAIIKAYEDKLAIFNAKMSDLKSLQENNAKINPGFFRQIENMVLRKNCIEYLNSHELTGTSELTKGSTMQDFQVNYEAPALETAAARTKFFEQAFEWNLMSYYFYPFYWADKNKWTDLYNEVNVDDPTFRAFLQSGMARVMVTVRPGFEEAVNWYMSTGQIWNGGQVPTVNDPLFLSIVDELRETEGAVEETWETRVPTSLTVIQSGSIGLEASGLPCDDDCADYKLFDSDGNPVLDGNGKQISTNPIVQTNHVLGNNQVVIHPYGGGQIDPNGGGNSGNPTEGANPDPYAGQNATM